MKKDSKGNSYEEVENIRITYVESKNRAESKDWAENDVIRFQAYKGGDTKSLHIGAEIPIEGPTTLIEIIEALCKIFKEKSK